MPIIPTLLIILLLFSACQSPPLLHEADEALKIAIGLREGSTGAKELLQSLRPTLDDCRAIMQDDSNALRLCRYAETLHEDMPPRGLPLGDSSRSETQLLSCTSQQFASGFSCGLPLAYTYLPFRPNLHIYAFRYHRPDDSRDGIRYDGLLRVNNRFVFIPKLYAALPRHYSS